MSKITQLIIIASFNCTIENRKIKDTLENHTVEDYTIEKKNHTHENRAVKNHTSEEVFINFLQ